MEYIERANREAPVGEKGWIEGSLGPTATTDLCISLWPARHAPTSARKMSYDPCPSSRRGVS